MTSGLATFPRDVVGVCQTCGHEWRCVAWEQTPSGGACLDTPRCPRCGAGYDKLYCRELPEVEITTHSDTRRTFKDLGTGEERDGGPLPTMQGEKNPIIRTKRRAGRLLDAAEENDTADACRRGGFWEGDM